MKPPSYLHPEKRKLNYRTLKDVDYACRVRGGYCRGNRRKNSSYEACYCIEGEWFRIVDVCRAEILDWANTQAPLNRPL